MDMLLLRLQRIRVHFCIRKDLDISVKGSNPNFIFALMLSVIVWSLWEGLGLLAPFSPSRVI